MFQVNVRSGAVCVVKLSRDRLFLKRTKRRTIQNTHASFYRLVPSTRRRRARINEPLSSMQLPFDNNYISQ